MVEKGNHAKVEAAPAVRVVNAVEPGSYEAGLISQSHDLGAFEEHVKDVLGALKAYAGDDPEKIEKFIKAYHKGVILKPEEKKI
ncbi:MAG: hypothetical protein NTY06_01900 [Candidatus Gottesmanbacteria bacterium]|nr:hypothetical protein [Candidatus Gottesmanbacteria bacterium]